jgi:hypothetical protein
MKKAKQVTPAPDWSAIFKRHPGLEAPGYKETCSAIQFSKKEKNGKD